MALTNAERQANWRQRNLVTVGDPAETIAETLIDNMEPAKLKKLVRYLNDHLQHPERTSFERAIALGRISFQGMTKKAALKDLRDNPSWRVEAITEDGKRYRNKVRLATREAAVEYGKHFVALYGYVGVEFHACPGEPATEGIEFKDGKPMLSFMHGQCGNQTWEEV